MLDIFPPEEHGQAMAIWGMGVIFGPIIGPMLGGWLTDNFSWRSVFYINIPIGVLALVGVFAFLPRERADRALKFDVLGFALLSVAVAAVQLCLDRGQSRDWFESREIVIEASIAGVAFLLFIFHTLTADQPFLPRALFKDRNYVGATALGFACGVVVLSVLALLPSLLQNLLGYPVLVSGLVSAPRGVAMVMTMLIAGRMVREVDPRLMIVIGLIGIAYGYYQMSGFSLQMDYWLPVVSGAIMGLATGFIFLPTSILTFSTLDPSLRSTGAGANALFRNVGNSMGISVMEMALTQKSAMVQTHLSEAIRPDNPMLRTPSAGFSLAAPERLAGLVGEIGRQASMVAYTDLFRVMGLATLLSALLLLTIRPPRMRPA
jgi:DHA2 family multidrug resistance protein